MNGERITCFATDTPDRPVAALELHHRSGLADAVRLVVRAVARISLGGFALIAITTVAGTFGRRSHRHGSR